MSFLEWGLLIRGQAAQIEQAVFGIYKADHVKPAFGMAPGSAGWHLVYGTGHGHLGVEMALAEALVEQGYELVYAMELVGEFPYVYAHKRGGSPEFLDCDPDRLAESLGCAIPHQESRKPYLSE